MADVINDDDSDDEFEGFMLEDVEKVDSNCSQPDALEAGSDVDLSNISEDSIQETSESESSNDDMDYNHWTGNFKEKPTSIYWTTVRSCKHFRS